MALCSYPNLGIGIGFKSHLFQQLITQKPSIGWLELLSEEFIDNCPGNEQILDTISRNYPITLHSISLSIGSPDSLDYEFLKKLKQLARKTNCHWISDHLCWGRLSGVYHHELLPLPHTRSVVNYVAERARIVQDFLEIPFALENIPNYLSFHENEMNESQFYSAIIEKSDINIVLDVDNLLITCKNLNLNPYNYINTLPIHKIIQTSVGGHIDYGPYYMHAHHKAVQAKTWDIYQYIYQLINGTSTLLEWDDKKTPLDEIVKQAMKAKDFQEETILLEILQ